MIPREDQTHMFSRENSRRNFDRSVMAEAKQRRQRSSGGQKSHQTQSAGDTSADSRVTAVPKLARGTFATMPTTDQYRNGLQVLSATQQTPQPVHSKRDAYPKSSEVVAGRSWAALVANKPADLPATANLQMPASPQSAGRAPAPRPRSDVVPTQASVEVVSPAVSSTPVMVPATESSQIPACLPSTTQVLDPRLKQPSQGINGYLTREYPATRSIGPPSAAPLPSNSKQSKPESPPRGFTFSRGSGVVIHHAVPVVSNTVSQTADAVCEESASSDVHIAQKGDAFVEATRAQSTQQQAPPSSSPKDRQASTVQDESSTPDTVKKPVVSAPICAPLSWAERAKAAAALQLRPHPAAGRCLQKHATAEAIETGGTSRIGSLAGNRENRSIGATSSPAPTLPQTLAESVNSKTLAKVQPQNRSPCVSDKPAVVFGDIDDAHFGASNKQLNSELTSQAALDSLCATLPELRISAYDDVDTGVYTRRLQPRGIQNPGNLCFVNSVLQALMGTSAFCYLLAVLSKAKLLVNAERSPVLCALAAFAAELGQKGPVAAQTSQIDGTKNKRMADVVVLLGGQPVTSSLVMELVHKFVPGKEELSASTVEQEDADEFLIWLLDSMHEELLALKKLHSGPSTSQLVLENKPSDSMKQENIDHDVLNAGDDGWLVQSGKRAVRKQEVSAAPQELETLVSLLFQGKLATSVACPGAPTSVTVHPFKALSLPISNDTIRSITDALDSFTASESIPDYKPTGESSPREATKCERLQLLPEILTLHLMRFQYSGRSAKINKFVSYERKLALRSSWLAPGARERGATYNLVATVTHHGKSLSSGHYTADVVSPDGTWLRFDDSNVFRVGQQSVLSERPYILVYQRARDTGKRT